MSEEKELTIHLSEQVKGAMASNPEMAEALKMFAASMRQAFYGFEQGQYKTMEDAMEAITGERPQKLTEEEEIELDKRILQVN